MEELPRPTTWDVENPVNHGRFTISSGDRRISEASTVVKAHNERTFLVTKHC